MTLFVRPRGEVDQVLDLFGIIDDDAPGIWFLAAFHTAPACCERDIKPGDEIRDDGTGQYEHRTCVEWSAATGGLLRHHEAVPGE